MPTKRIVMEIVDRRVELDKMKGWVDEKGITA
jgi:hypothetical protein